MKLIIGILSIFVFTSWAMEHNPLAELEHQLTDYELIIVNLFHGQHYYDELIKNFNAYNLQGIQLVDIFKSKKNCDQRLENFKIKIGCERFKQIKKLTQCESTINLSELD
ncbi:MAG: hypothetical protein ACOYT8_05355 [Candidatus Dependentiae bacterium]